MRASSCVPTALALLAACGGREQRSLTSPDDLGPAKSALIALESATDARVLPLGDGRALIGFIDDSFALCRSGGGVQPIDLAFAPASVAGAVDAQGRLWESPPP